MNERVKEVAFADENLKNAFFKLRDGKFEEKQLFEFINRAIIDLKENPMCGIRVPNNLIPKDYIKKYRVTNLWKYNFPNAWRLTYTLVGDSIKIVSVLLEWMNHKDYEKRFGYNWSVKITKDSEIDHLRTEPQDLKKEIQYLNALSH